MDSGRTALGILVGIGAGALLGILFAPERGSTTRKRILDKGQDYADDLRGKFDTLYDDVASKYESFLEEAKTALASQKL